MNLEKHISVLLYSHECVIAPGFGAFLAHKHQAALREGSVYPPSKQLGFNGTLQKSDGLLVQTIALRHQLSFEEAQREVENQIRFWKNHLENNSTLVLNHLGVFVRTESGALEFQPNEQNYLLDSFGLESVRTKLILQPAQTHSSQLGWWKAASVIPILLGGYLYFAKPQPVADFVNEQWSGFVTPLINSQTTEEKIPETAEVKVAETPVAEDKSEENMIYDYQVIAGAFRVKSEAETLEARLKEKGFDKAQFTQKKGSYFYVAFATFPTKEEALEYRKTVRDEYPETWVFSLRED